MSVAPAAPRDASADRIAVRPVYGWQLLPSRIVTFCLVEVQKLRHDRTELITRAIQPLLWLVIFGETFSRVHAIETGGISYLDFLAPGVIAQSGLFIAIFYGIQLIWERDAGILAKIMVTPTPRGALIVGKTFAAAVRSLSQVVVVLIASLLLGVSLQWNPFDLLGVAAAVTLGAMFFSCLSMIIAGLANSRERLMGIGQAITMPLFFASNALYPVAIMPRWLQIISRINPLSYEVSALRALLIGTPTTLWLDYLVLAGSALIGVAVASRLLDRLVG